jgi:hypothetical protein
VRTTLSLEDDVANMLNKEMRRSGTSFKQAVNHFLRLGLVASKQQKREPFVVTPRPLGLPPGLNYDNVEELIEKLEGLEHK